ncbi:hypothetical protein TL16_g02558 [Triparma laevis f. inornata]|uniref:Aldehyde dehydrogenase domain-containing protein n=1 Tax=Triparma laevis f. inornata TaxID=1714386 RepID=A0A9W6ZYJ9_9STRA|nr:hypothetical protein TL16_g02558 [Triparma laevis f. inornata]
MQGIGLDKFDEMTVKNTVTISNVHNLSLFELRQSLKTRGEFLDDYNGPISYEILLNRMVGLLGEDKAKEDKLKIDELEKKKLGVEKSDGSVETLQEKLAREKKERKADAIERSKKRQADKKYFEEMKKRNEEGGEEVGRIRIRSWRGRGKRWWGRCGNTFIYKPSECTPLTALKIAEILKEAGLPDGVFNVVVGDRTTGPMLSSHNEVKKLSFTGSTETGIRIVKDAADTLKKVTMELGGKSPLLVFEDADIDNAVAAAMMSNWYTQGEICSNATRVFVHKSIKGEFTKKLVARTKQLVIGDPLDPNTHVGAMIMPPDNKSGHLDRVVGFIERAKQDPDNKLILGGNTHTIEAGKVDGRGGVGNEGCYVEPTIFECSNDNSELVKEEVFGPVMSLLEFEDEDDAVKRANDTKWGLGAGVMTNNLARAHRIAKKFQSGNVWINNYNLTPSEMPFGGYGMSGYGRECGTYAIDSWTQIKNVYVEMGDVDSSCYPK